MFTVIKVDFLNRKFLINLQDFKIERKTIMTKLKRLICLSKGICLNSVNDEFDIDE